MSGQVSAPVLEHGTVRSHKKVQSFGDMHDFKDGTSMTVHGAL